MGKVSGKTHTKEQLDHWANLHNPNNKAYRADADNRANQKNPKPQIAPENSQCKPQKQSILGTRLGT